jgi:hypothetical protein
MAEHALCPRCGHENPSENRFCGSCGVSLEASSDVVARRENDLTVKDHALPARLGHISKAVAVGLAMLGAEVGLSWLRHRIRAEEDRPSTLSAREPNTVVSEGLLTQSLEEVFIQHWEGDHRSRIFAWRAIRSIVTTESTDGRR